MREGTGERGTRLHLPPDILFSPVEYPQWGKSAGKEARLGLIFPGFPISWKPRYPLCEPLVTVSLPVLSPLAGSA